MPLDKFPTLYGTEQQAISDVRPLFDGLEKMPKAMLLRYYKAALGTVESAFA